MKNTKGITLIALVITIIVLLILAGVTIVILTGDNGLITKANTAKGEAKIANEKERIALGYQDYQMSKYIGETLSLDEALTDAGLLEKTVTGNGPWTIIVEDRIYTLLVDGTITVDTSASEERPKALGTITSSNYGDYIDLGKNAVGTSATTDDWKILYKDTDNNVVYAILADYLPNDNTAVTESGLDTENDYGVYSETDRETFIEGLNHTTAWNNLISSDLVSKGALAKGAITGEILMASYYDKHKISLDYTLCPYLWKDPANAPNIDNGDSYNASDIDSLYMPHVDSEANGYNDCYGFWLASPYDDSFEAVWYVLCDGTINNDDYNSTIIGVCPVVSLPFDIQVTNKVSNGVRIWSTAK